MMKLAILALIFTAGVSLVIATGGDFNTIDFVASAPYCYSHRTGGGAFNDDTSGKDMDTVESLEGKDFRCGDIISYMVVVEMKDVVQDAKQNLQMKVSFLADPTGQSGVGFGNLAGVSINKPDLPVENGNNYKATSNTKASQPDGGCLGSYGTDGAAYSNGDEEVIVNSRQLTRPIFTQGATLEAVITITNLEAGERVIVRVDAFIYCLPGSRPTGNIQGDILWKVSMADWSSIAGGQQTVPLLGVGNIQGIDCVAVDIPLVGNDFKADLTTYYPDGGVYSDFKYSWTFGAYALTNAGSGTFELHTFETTCSFLHSGEYLYSQSDCGCESTKIGADQPQLFFNASGTYYDANFASMTEPYTGIAAKRYTRAGADQTIQYLWLNAATGDILRIDWVDGRIMVFTNLVKTGLTAADFATPTVPCTCRRRTDIAIVIERSATVDSSDLQNAKIFAANLTRQFQVGADHNQFAVMYYGSTPTTALGINAGNDPINVINAINAIPCDSKSGGCGPGADGDVVAALNAAVLELQSSTRAFTGKVVIFVTDGWTNPSAEVMIAVEAARAAGVEVMVVSYLTTMMAIDLDDLTTNPDYLVQRFTLGNLAALDPIDISSRVCLINQFPCGEGCCGYCDSACGTCKPVDSCPTVQGCLTASKLVGNCCVNVTTDTCPDKLATCEVGSCNAQANSCSYTPTCQKPANDNCFDWNCVNGTCIKDPLFSVNQCVVQTCENNNIVTRSVQCPTSDACTTWACNNNTGCFSTPVNRTRPATTAPCTRDVCDPARGGWVVDTVTTLPNGLPCSTSCSLTCSDTDTQCVKSYCVGTVGNYHCEPVNTNCTNPGPCYTTVCDPVLGCQTTELDCDDGNACTVDSCANGVCVHDPVPCTSTDRCRPSTCNNQTGACETSEKTCSDGIGCTDDTCDPTTGDCVYTPNHVTCNIQDRCHNYFCTPRGCVAEDLPCPDDGLFCTVAVCVAFRGCNNQSLSCNNSISVGTDGKTQTDCSTVECREEEGQCVKEDKECALPPTLIVTTALAAGVIAGIVVGVIAFIACAGGASFAAFQQMGTGGTSAVVNNPLYRGDKKDGLNPLYQAGQ